MIRVCIGRFDYLPDSAVSRFKVARPAEIALSQLNPVSPGITPRPSLSAGDVGDRLYGQARCRRGSHPAGLVGSLGIIWRIRIYSRWGPARFAWSCAAFTIWNAAVVGVSRAFGWWEPHQPGAHFTVSAAVAATPLLLAAWLVGKGR